MVTPAEERGREVRKGTLGASEKVVIFISYKYNIYFYICMCISQGSTRESKPVLGIHKFITWNWQIQ